jgi:hypothetical protein
MTPIALRRLVDPRQKRTDIEARSSEAAGRTPVNPMTQLRAKP